MAPECLPICICNPQINCKQMPAVNVDVKRLSFSADPNYFCSSVIIPVII